MLRITASLLFSLFLVSLFKAQDNNSNLFNEFSMFAGPIYSNIKNDNIKNDKYADSYGAIAYNLGANYCFYLTRNIGINIGAEYNQYKNSAVYKGGYRSSVKAVDKDNNIYYPTVETNYTDTRTIHSIDIPICLRINAPINENFSWFLDLGIKLNAIITNKINQDGILNKKGTYPLQNTPNEFYLVENFPIYGYTNATYTDLTKEIESKSMGVSALISTGFKVRTTEKTFLLVSGHYMSGISDMGPKTQLDYQNVFGEKNPYSPFKLFQAGMKVGFGILLY